MLYIRLFYAERGITGLKNEERNLMEIGCYLHNVVRWSRFN